MSPKEKPAGLWGRSIGNAETWLGWWMVLAGCGQCFSELLRSCLVAQGPYQKLGKGGSVDGWINETTPWTRVTRIQGKPQELFHFSSGSHPIQAILLGSSHSHSQAGNGNDALENANAFSPNRYEHPLATPPKKQKHHISKTLLPNWQIIVSSHEEFSDHARGVGARRSRACPPLATTRARRHLGSRRGNVQ